MAAAAAVDPTFARWWDGGLRERSERAERWITAHAAKLHAAVA